MARRKRRGAERLVLGPDEAEAVRRLSEEARRSGEWPWQRDAAARTGGLPVYSDIGAVLVLRDDGAVLSISNATDEVEEVREDCWILVARVKAAKRYPALKSLAPVRPSGAPDCPQCSGRGWVHDEGVACGDCWGVGWHP